jgi:hypothetical protein
VKIGRTIGVGTSVVQRVLGVNRVIAVFMWALAGPARCFGSFVPAIARHLFGAVLHLSLR